MRPVGALRLDFYQRLSSRERVLLLTVAGTVFVLGNLIALHTLFSSFGELRRQREEKGLEWQATQFLVQEQPMWVQRAAWLRAVQPKLASRDVAGVELQRQVKGFADQNHVILSSQQIRPLATSGAIPSPYFVPVTMDFETRSDWKQLFWLIFALQKPENFIVFQSALLQSDEAAGRSMMKGTFRIAKWYAPAAK